MEIESFINKLKDPKQQVTFQETMQIVEGYYTFTPVAFTNGTQVNKKGENSGSCKLFSFAKIQKLNKEETLACFGKYYQDVLDTPQGTDHQNIRNFMNSGWDGIFFEQNPLEKK